MSFKCIASCVKKGAKILKSHFDRIFKDKIKATDVQ